jgi:hypothetical protein
MKNMSFEKSLNLVRDLASGSLKRDPYAKKYYAAPPAPLEIKTEVVPVLSEKPSITLLLDN